MFRRYSVNYAVMSMFADMIFTGLALFLASQLRATNPGLIGSNNPLPASAVPPVIYIMVLLIWGAVFLFASAYDPNRVYRAVDEFQVVGLATAFAALVFAGLLYLTYRDISRSLFISFVVIDIALLIFWRVLMRMWWRHTLPHQRKRVLILGAGDVGKQMAQMVETVGSDRLSLVGFLDDDIRKHNNGLNILGTLDDLRAVVEQYDVEEVVIALPRRAYQRMNEIVQLSHTLPTNVRIVPDYFSLALYRAKAEDFGGMPLINLRDPALNEVQRFVKRLLDIGVSATALLLMSPLMLLVAAAIKLGSDGPVFFRQERVGENGRIFKMIKFRSMVVNADKLQHLVNKTSASGHIIHKSEQDPRVTRVGRLIRRTSLDELPQLINVLRGDMSLVGPRPELPWLVKEYDIWQRKRFAVPQGITGWWQVNGRSDKPMHLHTDEDLFYIQNYSLWLDIYILLKTPFVVLRGRGAY